MFFMVPGLFGAETPYPFLNPILLIGFPAAIPIEDTEPLTIPIAAEISSRYKPPVPKAVNVIHMLFVIVSQHFNTFALHFHLRMYVEIHRYGNVRMAKDLA